MKGIAIAIEGLQLHLYDYKPWELPPWFYVICDCVFHRNRVFALVLQPIRKRWLLTSRCLNHGIKVKSSL